MAARGPGGDFEANGGYDDPVYTGVPLTAMDVLGSADPWNDLWFYANPVFVLPT